MVKITLSRKLRRDAYYADQVEHFPLALGCSRCPELATCGGLHNATGAFDCLSFCCGKPETCDNVCVRNPTFVDRVREIDGFKLNNFAAEGDRWPTLESMIPMVYSGSRRTKVFAPVSAALSFHSVVSRARGELKFQSHEALCNAFRLKEGTPIVLSGTNTDRPLEHWWTLGEARIPILRQLGGLGVIAATTPNYSVFSDRPRWDDMHGMKRIAIVWSEMNDAGIPTALHPNARTARDYERWTEFIAGTPGVSALAFEFATGAGRPDRVGWHVDHLCALADSVPRPLKLVIRGGVTKLPQLLASFAEVTVLDTDIYIRTINRRAAKLGAEGRVSWERVPRHDVLLDDLIQHNYSTVRTAFRNRVRRAA